MKLFIMKNMATVALRIAAVTTISQCSTGKMHQPPVSPELRKKLENVSVKMMK